MFHYPLLYHTCCSPLATHSQWTLFLTQILGIELEEPQTVCCVHLDIPLHYIMTPPLGTWVISSWQGRAHPFEGTVGLIGFLPSHSRPSKRNVNLMLGSSRSRPHTAHTLRRRRSRGDPRRLYIASNIWPGDRRRLCFFGDSVCFGPRHVCRYVITLLGCAGPSAR